MNEIDRKEAKRHAGHFKPGQSGNPSGRPKESYRISDLAKEHTEEALTTLVEIVRDKKAPHSARVHAATALLDRAWGKPVQSINLDAQILTYGDYLDLMGEREKRYQAVITAEVKELPLSKEVTWDEVL